MSKSLNLLTVICLLVLLASPPALAGEKSADPNPGLHSKALDTLLKPWKGDLSGMVDRRYIRALVTYSKTGYFLDGARERGLTYEALRAFEKQLNQSLGQRHLKISLLLVPVKRDELFKYLQEGRGDLAAANLTITPERQRIVDFSDPFASDVRELVVTGPTVPGLQSLDDLAGRRITVRKSSSYYQSLLALNRKLKEAGKSPVEIELADERLETEDLLEMVNAGLISITVADDYLARFWSQIFDQIKVHEKWSLRSGGRIAWAFRRGSPELKGAINKFVRSHKKGTLMGNVVMKRYLKNNHWAKNPLAAEDRKRFTDTIELFRKYSDEYGFDWLMIAALAYQESGLDHSVKSSAGAVGVMQILPTTAAGHPVNIPDIKGIDKNINAGVKYLRFLHDEYFADSAMDEVNQVLFTFAAYNAGPAKVAGLRKTASKMGLNPNLWFNNVEVAAAKVIGRETVQYVSNILKYYLAYKQIAEAKKVKEANTR